MSGRLASPRAISMAGKAVKRLFCCNVGLGRIYFGTYLHQVWRFARQFRIWCSLSTRAGRGADGAAAPKLPMPSTGQDVQALVLAACWSRNRGDMLFPRELPARLLEPHCQKGTHGGLFEHAGSVGLIQGSLPHVLPHIQSRQLTTRTRRRERCRFSPVAIRLPAGTVALSQLGHHGYRSASNQSLPYTQESAIVQVLVGHWNIMPPIAGLYKMPAVRLAMAGTPLGAFMAHNARAFTASTILSRFICVRGTP